MRWVKFPLRQAPRRPLRHFGAGGSCLDSPATHCGWTMETSVVSVEELLAFRASPSSSALVVVSVEDCPPCDMVGDALALATFPEGISVKKAIASSTDKKSFGSILKAGITRFPRVEFYARGERVARHDGAQGDNARQVARWLEGIVASGLRGENPDAR